MTSSPKFEGVYYYVPLKVCDLHVIAKAMIPSPEFIPTSARGMV